MPAFPFLNKKKVSIWGFGYLGYTAALRMQEHGFFVSVFDFDPKRHDAFEKREYPSQQQKGHWSLRNAVPDLDRERMRFCSAPEEMFEDSYVHLVAMPIVDKGKAKGINLEKLVELFSQNAKTDLLILFQSVGFPGQIDELFVKPMKEAKVPCHIGTAFRSDWVLEEFQAAARKQVLAANDSETLSQIEALFQRLKIPYSTLGNVKEAEVYENAQNALSYTATALVNQLALGYPNIDFQKIAGLLFEQVDLSACQLGIGAGGYRMPFSVDALMAGSALPDCLSILKEAESVNFSTVLSYSDYLARQNYRSVLIMGITSRENQKDLIAISPSLTLAETMNNRGLKVYLNDPHFTDAELRDLTPFSEPVRLDSLPEDLDAVLVMSAHSQYRNLSQERLDACFHKNIRLVVDNPGLFVDYRFQHATYHRVGDGKINLLK